MYAGENSIQETNTNLSTSGAIKTNRIYGNNTDDILAYETDDITLANTDSAEYAFCTTKVIPSNTDFTKYGWTSLVSRCNDLQNQYTTTARKMFFVQKDNLGSTIALTDASGSLVQSYGYDVYGSPYVLSGTGYVAMKDFVGNLHGNNRFFTGREYDNETGLYYLRARYYDPVNGRFISRDPIGQVDNVDLYSYVGNRPDRFVDLMGLAKQILNLATMQFNQVGSIMATHHRFYDTSPVDILLRPVTLMKTMQYASLKNTSFNDTSLMKNIFLKEETQNTNSSNIKANTNFMKYADNAKTCQPDGDN